MIMPWETIFNFAMIWATLCWLVLGFAPNRETVLPYLFHLGCGLLAVTYTGLMIPLMAGWVDPGGPQPVDFSNLAGVMALFDSKGGATIGWIHYLTFDLFVGIWIARNADRHGYMRWAQIPILFFVFMLGPIGLTLYLLLRLTCKNRPEKATIPH
jgi:Domain of unknown function (DUF4281)